MQAILDPQACYVRDRKRRPRPTRKDNSHVLQIGNNKNIILTKIKKQAIRPILTKIKKYYLKRGALRVLKNYGLNKFFHIVKVLSHLSNYETYHKKVNC